MSRLTYINEENDYELEVCSEREYSQGQIGEMIYDIAQKLGKLEDLEEQLGCPLDAMFKAITYGVYYKDVANRMKCMVVDLHLNLDGEYVLYVNDEEQLLTSNYKKTWWLKEDRSE